MGKHVHWIALLGVVLVGCPAAHEQAARVCEGAESCELECPNGSCREICSDESECTGGCEGGACDFTCRDSASCEFACRGGGCVFRCEDPARCVTTCEGGGCENGEVAPEEEPVPVGPIGDGRTRDPDGSSTPGGTLFCGSGRACECGTNATCVMECGGGSCDLFCGTNATCYFDCAGGGCNFFCGTNADCFLRCPSGDCGLSCGTNADCVSWE